MVLLPRQSRLANSERCWNWFDRRTVRGAGEAAIVAAQIGEAIEKFAVDVRRVYVAGLSSGGSLAPCSLARRSFCRGCDALRGSVRLGLRCC